MAKLVFRPSPNFNDRPTGVPISCVVLHATESHHAEQDLTWLQSKAAKASCHDLVDRDGTYYRLVDVNKRAWHAGESSFRGVPDVNDYSIGIELANDAHGEPFPEVQLAAAAALVASYCKRFAIPLDRITRHSDIALPKGRKSDPGPAFDFPAFLRRVEGELAGGPLT